MAIRFKVFLFCKSDIEVFANFLCGDITMFLSSCGLFHFNSLNVMLCLCLFAHVHGKFQIVVGNPLRFCGDPVLRFH